MSVPREPSRVRLLFSILGLNETVVNGALSVLERQFGPACAVGPVIPFDRTDYYEPEMGENLVRRFAAFRNLIPPDRLPRIKLWSVDLERKLAVEQRRTVNLDPGYISAERLVLATGKNYTHRIYLGHGVFADLTLIYQHRTFHPLAWTYPDYADAEVVSFMNEIRRGYLDQAREESRNQ